MIDFTSIASIYKASKEITDNNIAETKKYLKELEEKSQNLAKAFQDQVGKAKKAETASPDFYLESQNRMKQQL